MSKKSKSISIIVSTGYAKQNEHDNYTERSDYCVGVAQEEVFAADPGRGGYDEVFPAVKSMHRVIVVNQQGVISLSDIGGGINFS